MVQYDKEYKVENLFGRPYPKLIKYFKNIEKKGKLLDIGCGQGRDSLPLAKLGFDVLGIDVSRIGVEQMLKKTQNKNFKLKGIVGDFLKIKFDENFDFVLLDSMVHFYKKDIKWETKLLNKAFSLVKKNGQIIILMQKTKTKKRELLLNKVVEKFDGNKIFDEYIEFPDFKMFYRMLVIKKNH